MKTMMMFLVFTMSGCLMEDLPLPALEPDAEPPTEEVDATPPVVEPDATVSVAPDADTPECDGSLPLPPDATVPVVPDAGTPECDATPETPDAAPPLPPDAAPVPPPDATPVTPDAGCPACDDAGDCSDGFAWTSDSCAAGTCAYVLTDCGGMQIRPSESAVTCMFWGGFGTSEPAPALGSFVPEGLDVGPAGGLWKAAPASACSAICYSSGGNRVALDLQTEWSGATSSLVHAQYNGVTKGTFDGLNLEY